MGLVNGVAGVIFDYGGVLVAHQSKEDVESLASIAGIPVDLFNQLYWAQRAAYDRGDIEGLEYWRHLGSAAGKKLDDATIHSLIGHDSAAWMKFYGAMYDFVDELRAEGKRVAVLSNMPKDLGLAIKFEGFGFRSFDHVTLSYEVRSAKPDAAIYRRCLEGIRTAPEDTLFLDDRIENIRAAQTLGIQAIQFTTPDEMLPRLRG
ncbi:MAG: HAD family phosphatase [Bryobacteraceae bacterium]